ncbi:MAG: pyridoxamine 5'-phosphate oxidase family protein [Gammaproteobacteria bacterium]
MGRRLIHEHLSEDHQAFYRRLPVLLLGSVDGYGRPFASMLVNRPGFVTSPDPRTLSINGGFLAGDPVRGLRAVGSPVGVLGMNFVTRERIRLAGRITRTEGDLTILAVDQAFGNCPQYIQSRAPEVLTEKLSPTVAGAVDPRVLRSLDKVAAELITGTDTFFIATCHPDRGTKPSHGADISHRGGKPGFVRVDDEYTLTWPDFRGNSFFNTLGNLALNPMVALLFPNFEEGSLLMLRGEAHIVWDAPELRWFAGAERLIRFRIHDGRFTRRAMPIRWHFLDYSPSLRHTDSWADAGAKVAKQPVLE